VVGCVNRAREPEPLYCPYCRRTLVPVNAPQVRGGEENEWRYRHDLVPHPAGFGDDPMEHEAMRAGLQ
jgi:hypothetical protein